MVEMGCDYQAFTFPQGHLDTLETGLFKSFWGGNWITAYLNEQEHIVIWLGIRS